MLRRCPDRGVSLSDNWVSSYLIGGHRKMEISGACSTFQFLTTFLHTKYSLVIEVSHVSDFPTLVGRASERILRKFRDL